jgi:hypothetical protein
MAASDSPVVIIGAGLAGLTVALHLAAKHPVILLAKRSLSEAATAWAQGGIVGVLGSDDSVDLHVNDTQDAGAGLVDEQTARFIAEQSAEAIGWLVDRGVPFSSDPDGPLGLHLTREGGHAVRRIAHAADATGKAIHDALLDEVKRHPNIEVRERWMAVDVITSRHLNRDEPNRCYGVYALDIDRQRVEKDARHRMACDLRDAGITRVRRQTARRLVHAPGTYHQQALCAEVDRWRDRCGLAHRTIAKPLKLTTAVEFGGRKNERNRRRRQQVLLGQGRRKRHPLRAGPGRDRRRSLVEGDMLAAAIARSRDRQGLQVARGQQLGQAMQRHRGL